MDFGVDSATEVAAPNDDATLPGRRLQSPVESCIDKKFDFTLSLSKLEASAPPKGSES